jgi:hypothetical protein
MGEKLKGLGEEIEGWIELGNIVNEGVGKSGQLFGWRAITQYWMMALSISAIS